MSISQNGFPAIASGSDARMRPLLWVTGRVLDGPVFTVLDHLARRFHNEVEPIRRDHSWGYASRPIRGAEVTSNHASGTAVDFNAPNHPLGRSGTFSSKQRTALLQILRDLDGVVRWGGTYSGRKDEMHFEINASPAAVAAVARRIATAPTAGTATTATSTTTSTSGDAPMSAAELAVLRQEIANLKAALDDYEIIFFREDSAAIYEAQIKAGTYYHVESNAALANRKAVLNEAGIRWKDWPTPAGRSGFGKEIS